MSECGVTIFWENEDARTYGRATEDVYMVELAEDFGEDFDGKIEQF